MGNNIKVVRADGRQERFDPSNHFYVFPMQLGKSWTRKAVQRIDDRTIDVSVKVTVHGEEEVQTPAGKIKAIKLTREARWKERERDRGGLNVWTYWYNGGIKRWVVGEVTNTTTDGKVLQRERHELASFDLK